jgi:hypothetical protein
MAGNTCPANSLTGVPVSFTGTIKRDNFEVNYGDIVRDIQLRTAFSIRSTPRKFLDKTHGFIEDNANDTLFINRIPYTLQTIQFCKHWSGATTTITVQPESDSPTEAFGQLVFAFKKAYSDYGGEPVYFVIVPISDTQDTSSYNADIDSYFSDILNERIPQVKSLEPFFRGKTLRLGYQSCVELQNPGDRAVSTVHMGVLLCPGVYIKTATVEGVKSYFGTGKPIPSFILPAFAHPGLDTAKSNNNGTFTWSQTGETYTVSRDLTTKQFFIFNTDISPNAPTPTAAKVDENGLRTTQQYKCVPLDRLKDISGNLVLMDPATGARTLADTLQDESEALQLELKDVLPAKPDDGTMSSAVRTGLIVGGVILGLVVAGFAWYWIYTRGQPTTAKGVANTIVQNIPALGAAVAAAAASNSINTPTRQPTPVVPAPAAPVPSAQISPPTTNSVAGTGLITPNP